MSSRLLTLTSTPLGVDVHFDAFSLDLSGQDQSDLSLLQSHCLDQLQTHVENILEYVSSDTFSTEVSSRLPAANVAQASAEATEQVS